MARKTIQEKLLARNSKVNLKSIATKYGWYYIQMLDSTKISVVATAEFTLDEFVKTLFKGVTPTVFEMGKDIFMLSPHTENEENSPPSFWLKNEAHYYPCLIVCLLDKDSLKDIQPIPFSSVIPSIESLQFSRNKFPLIEITSLNH